MPNSVPVLFKIFSLIFFIFVSACSNTFLHNPPPQELYREAQVLDNQQVRLWGDEIPHILKPGKNETLDKFRQINQDNINAKGELQLNLLALSGGGEDGAYGAGLLNGWTKSGTRPEFQIVTGVSTGALIAPFAFLGPEYDTVLEEIYTTINFDSLLIFKPLRGIISGIALTDNTPMRKLIEKHLTEEVIEKIAIEHKKGRRLVVATTNIDAGRSVLWNLGEIAISKSPKSLSLFRDILTASSAIPGVFPPVKVPIEINGKKYDELHVDGGVSAQVVGYPPRIDIKQLETLLDKKIALNLYLIRNTKIVSSYESVSPTFLNVSRRSLEVMIKQQGVSNINQIYLMTQRDGFDFFLTHVPDEFDFPLPEPFDQKYMQALYKIGYKNAEKGIKWKRQPPELSTSPY
ncbi:patatin-like phospholipase family protein [Kiloniella majae]|uniref:patatin-like phospholipase family protein n=1 Tax=Kiloniella majae TaxID=1938558 RepID=UPI000A278732|nr:patatin-like phospholipase family protein [Kiloniella majae]